ncbi:unnamed protein product [Cladocopium goreaui]|uniref:Uncharacterized protein n=1 Tax=Cladocopium goreaui TaxID=2562237 RepID=A0A9P1D7X3_9DINO|nr:unnamed protein product [Cladocopium goreaui]
MGTFVDILDCILLAHNVYDKAVHLLVADGSPLELRCTWDIVKEFIPDKPLPPAPEGKGWILLMCSADYSVRPVSSRDTQPSRFFQDHYAHVPRHGNTNQA